MKKLAVLVVAAVVAAAVAFAATSFFEAADDDAIDYVPANTFLYANVFLDPSTQQRIAIRDLLEHFPLAATPDEAADEIADLLNNALRELGLSFEEDVEPWLGKQIAFYLLPPERLEEDPAGAALIATDDAGATQDAIDEAIANSGTQMSVESHQGVDYKLGDDDSAVGIVEDFLVIGNEAGFRASVETALGGDSLGESDRFENTVGALEDDRLFLFFLDPQPIFAAIPRDQFPPGIMSSPLFSSLQRPVAAVAYARSDAVVFEGVGAAPPGATSDRGLVPRLPAHAWAVFGAADFGGMVESLLDSVLAAGVPGLSRDLLERQFQAETGLHLQRDVLSWIGDLGAFVEGTTLDALGGGIVIESRDPQASARAVDAIGRLAKRQGAPIRRLPKVDSVDVGFAIRDRSMPEAVYVVATDRAVIGVYGRSALEHALRSRPIERTAVYQDAADELGSDFTVGGLIGIAPVLDLVDGLGANREPIYQREVKPWLEPLSFVVFGSKLDGDSIVQRIVLGVR